MSFVNIATGICTLPKGVSEFLPRFAYALTDFGEIQCRICLQNVAEQQ
jgi:hypothetical protein